MPISPSHQAGSLWLNHRMRAHFLAGLRRRSLAGFTLVELVVTIAIAAILLTIGVPSFQSVIRTNRVAALTNDLSTALQLARSEAVTRGKQVTVCKSDDIYDSAPSCNTNANWQDGWLVFVDDDRNGSWDSGELQLRVGQPAITTAVITSSENFANYISFTQTGQTMGSSSTADGSFVICVAPEQRTIELNKIGRLAIQKGTCT
ncbi:GspH/FimT family pseudopilin [Imhoffiella purpurea]|uniref:Type II secretion system protein H n=1 Tax=Imhoffiella purpurea TaxID=1249627 RepID=W9V8Y0_9GAMM|nr:GspH/FimT family pseudopilin [Imhoffiella purpurea]EXJ15874.1 Type IV fimbrial biogenesis protein FimT [Imhoffiella purpurea]